MNVDYEFKLLPNKIKMEKRLRAFEIKFNFPAFRTKESSDPSEINSGNLKFVYAPKEHLLEFHSFQDYINQYVDIPISLESAAWSILDDVYSKIQPCYAVIKIMTELPDCASTETIAQRGWKKERDTGLYAQANDDLVV